MFYVFSLIGSNCEKRQLLNGFLSQFFVSILMFIIVHLQLLPGFKLNLVSSFSSYMGFEPNSTIQNQKIIKAFTDSYYINNCLYEDIKSGAIRFTNLFKSLYLVIEECSFAFCEEAREGGQYA